MTFSLPTGTPLIVEEYWLRLDFCLYTPSIGLIRTQEFIKEASKSFCLLGVWLILVSKCFCHRCAEDLCWCIAYVLQGPLMFQSTKSAWYVPISVLGEWRGQVCVHSVLHGTSVHLMSTPFYLNKTIWSITIAGGVFSATTNVSYRCLGEECYASLMVTGLIMILPQRQSSH